MTRRPRGNRPPRLDDVQQPAASHDRPAAAPSIARTLADRRVAGTHARFGPAEVKAVLTRLAAGHADATLGLDLGGVTREEAADALADVWGTTLDGTRVTIDPERTVAAAARAADRIAAVAGRGGRVALATGRPASLLAGYCVIVGALAPTDARIVDVGIFGPVPGGRSLWWVDSVATITDGASLLADDGAVAGDEWLFAVGRPDLVIADRGFAAAAVGAGIETIALADVDAVVLGVAARRELPVCVVPLDEQRPPGAYEPLTALLVAGLDGGTRPPPDPNEPGESALATRLPHSTTQASGTYAAPQSGEEG
ncbi:MAG TPA: phosphatase [Acidimicrobiia bacterium]|jgi:hypothetical protein